jgi:hypothetical protein
MFRALWCWLFHRNWWYRHYTDTPVRMDRRGERYTALVTGWACAQCNRAWSREYPAYLGSPLMPA